jgi:hypothetical protein
VLVDLGLPERLPGLPVDGMHSRTSVAKISRPTVSVRADDNRRPNLLAGAIFPVTAPALRLERIDFFVLAADKHPPTEDSCLGHSAVGEREAERPLQFQAGDVGGSEPRHVCRLEAVLRRIDTPTVPMWFVQRIGESSGAIVWACAACR